MSKETKKDVESKESISLEEMRKLKVCDTKKLSDLFGKIQEEIQSKAMPEGGALFVAMRFPNKDKETSTFLVNLNGVGVEVIDLFASIVNQDPHFGSMLSSAILKGSSPFEELISRMEEALK